MCLTTDKEPPKVPNLHKDHVIVGKLNDQRVMTLRAQVKIEDDPESAALFKRLKSERGAMDLLNGQ